MVIQIDNIFPRLQYLDLRKVGRAAEAVGLHDWTPAYLGGLRASGASAPSVIERPKAKAIGRIGKIRARHCWISANMCCIIVTKNEIQ